MSPDQVMMLCDAIDNAAHFLLFCFVFLAALTVVCLVAALFIGLAIRRTIRYLWRRMAEGSL